MFDAHIEENVVLPEALYDRLIANEVSSSERQDCIKFKHHDWNIDPKVMPGLHDGLSPSVANIGVVTMPCFRKKLAIPEPVTDNFSII